MQIVDTHFFARDQDESRVLFRAENPLAMGARPRPGDRTVRAEGLPGWPAVPLAPRQHGAGLPEAEPLSLLWGNSAASGATRIDSAGYQIYSLMNIALTE